MNIVFDMDNTIVDEFGATVRPGIIALLKRLKSDGHRLILWTHSKRSRARVILKDHGIFHYFDSFVFRENYDPLEKGLRKDIRKVKGDFLVDDDPEEISYMREIGRGGFLIQPFRKGRSPVGNELSTLYSAIGKAKTQMKGLFGLLRRKT